MERSSTVYLRHLNIHLTTIKLQNLLWKFVFIININLHTSYFMEEILDNNSRYIMN